jgi:hypothetical protein
MIEIPWVFIGYLLGIYENKVVVSGAHENIISVIHVDADRKPESKLSVCCNLYLFLASRFSVMHI